MKEAPRPRKVERTPRDPEANTAPIRDCKASVNKFLAATQHYSLPCKTVSSVAIVSATSLCPLYDVLPIMPPKVSLLQGDKHTAVILAKG